MGNCGLMCVLMLWLKIYHGHGHKCKILVGKLTNGGYLVPHTVTPVWNPVKTMTDCCCGCDCGNDQGYGCSYGHCDYGYGYSSGYICGCDFGDYNDCGCDF